MFDGDDGDPQGLTDILVVVALLLAAAVLFGCSGGHFIELQPARP